MYIEHADRDADTPVGLICPQCCTLVSVVSGVHRLMFHCLRGHGFGVDELIGTQSVGARESLYALVSAWQQKSAALAKVAEKARREGYPDLAASFEREVGKLEARLRAVRQAFRADETKVLAVREND
jgi:hypothetical protein